MTLPVSGAISFNNINVELGVSGTTQASLGQSSYRTLAGVASGAISMSNFYGKANQFAFTISSNQTNANLRSLAVAAGWNQSSKVVATIGAGVYISSNSTGTPALTVNGSFPGGVDLINNGYVVGMGGAGGSGGNGYATSSALSVSPGNSGYSGGGAISVSVGVTITNNGTFAGGGGGGGGGGCGGFSAGKDWGASSGGGGGGGKSSFAANSAAGAAGVASGTGSALRQGSAGGVGTYSAAGGGGAGGYYPRPIVGGTGGAGGSNGASGATGGTSYAPYGTSRGGGSGGAGGYSVSGNAYISWVSYGTRLGAIT